MQDAEPHRHDVLWWSRSGREYSRNRIVRAAFRALGWNVVDFSPRLGSFGDVEARLLRLPTPDLVWVPCFRQRDLTAAARFAGRRQVPLIFDPLISAFDKQVFEREKFDEDSPRGRRLRAWESDLFRRCDLVIADTQCHADYFQSTFEVPDQCLSVIPVGADESVFVAQPAVPVGDRTRVLFYGSFIGLQGPEIIAEAAVRSPDMHWTFLGDGPLKTLCQEICRNVLHVRFLPWVPLETLPEYIANADIVLGVFGASAKAGRVIPNKVYQALACGRAVVTQPSPSYPDPVRHGEFTDTGIAWSPPGDAAALAATLRGLTQPRGHLATCGVHARRTFERYFSETAIHSALADALNQIGF